MITFGGYYTGQVIHAFGSTDPYLAEEIMRLRGLRLNWAKHAFGAGLLFFSLVEVIHLYFKQVNFYRSYWTDATIAGALTYPMMLRHLKRQKTETLTPFYQSDLTKVGRLRSRCVRYCFVLVCLDLSMNLWILLMRK